MQIKILQLDAQSQAVSDFTPPVDTNKYFYHYQVKATGYTIAPIFWIGSPFPMQFVSACNVEHPEGLEQ